MVVIALLLQLAGAEAPPPPKVTWQARPEAREIAGCMSPLNSGGAPGLVRMRCLTARGDRLTDCSVVENSQAPDARYEKVGLCATRFFRIRAEGADGKPVLGFPVEVPFRVDAPAQRKAE